MRSNVSLMFVSYMVTVDGILLRFRSPDPGPGEASELEILLTDTELAGVTTQLQLRNLVQTKLERQIRATGIASKLDPLIGQTLTVA